jgi:hypothetical protein
MKRTPAPDDQCRRFRYVLGLLLVRKRALKLHNIRREESGDILVVRRPGDQETIAIPDPGLDEHEIEQVETELHQWLQQAALEETS